MKTPLCALSAALLAASFAMPAASQAASHYAPPMLGGPYSDWVHAFSKPVLGNAGEGAEWLRCPRSSPDQVTTEDQLVVDFIDNRASRINFAWCKGESYPSESMRRALAERYMPADSMKKRITIVEDATVSLYYSRTLARLFQASDFQDENGNLVQRGIFGLDPGTGSPNNYWTLDIGTAD
jgi:hypothetical protein